jgi:hypothetical protein
MKKNGESDSLTPSPVEAVAAEPAKTRTQREPDRLRQLDLLMKKLEKAQQAKARKAR